MSNKYRITIALKQPLDDDTILLGRRKTLSLREIPKSFYSQHSRLIVVGIYGLRKEARERERLLAGHLIPKFSVTPVSRGWKCVF